jgi:HdeA/HdeB family
MILRVLLLGLVGGLVLPASGGAQLLPNQVELAKFTCSQLLALDGDDRDRVLIYFNGYQDGKSGTKVWRDQVVGARVDRVIASCKATPTLPLLEAFAQAWKR